MSAFGVEAPISNLLVTTPSLRRKSESAKTAANQRAAVRFELARVVGETQGTLAQKQAEVLAAIISRRLSLTRVPCLATIRSLDRKWRLEGLRSVKDYRDDHNPRGPAPRTFPQAFIDKVEQLAVQHGTADLPHLARLASTAGAAFGVTPISSWDLRRILRGIGRARIIAGRQGSRAAIMDGFVRSTYPTSRTHELWFLDEGDPKYWAPGFCRVRGIWVSVRPAVIVVRDHRSGLFPGFWLSDPSRRINPETGYCCETGFDSDDVLAALLSAASPELAHPELREYAGVLPEQLQWDNAPQHVHLRQRLFDRPGSIRQVTGFEDPDAPEFIEPERDAPALQTKRIPSRRADLNGPIERYMGPLKRRLVGEAGHVDESIPLDRLTDGEDLGRSRSVAATDPRTRASRLTPVAVRKLPTIERLRHEIAEVLAEYNANVVLRRNGMTPRHAARRYAPPRVRHGDDLIRMLDLKTFTVTGSGIEVQRDGKSVVFYPIDNGVVLQRGALVHAYVDPLLRCLWMEHGRRLVHLKPTEDAAREMTAANVALTMESVARDGSNAAVESRGAWLDSQTSPGTAEEGRLAYEEIRDRPRTPPPTPPASLPPLHDRTGSNADSATCTIPAADADLTEFDPTAAFPQSPPRRTDV